MQEVCSSLDPMGPQIKSESPLNPLQNTILINGPQNQQSLHQSSQPLLQTKLGNCGDKSRAQDSYWMPTETGFINSQPSMAEFLTHLGPESPKLGSQQGYPLPITDNGIDSVPEYPWMKEKKTSRKGGNSNNQGRIFFWQIHNFILRTKL